MGKSSNIWSQNKLDAKLKSERGIGEFEKYKPYLKTQDFSTRGISHRVRGNLINRMYEFFSSTQYNAFLLIEDRALEKKSAIIDIREHFPLWDLKDLDVVDSSFKNIQLIDKKSKIDFIFTTTFLLTYSNQPSQYEAISVKYASDLIKQSTLERLELERRYWQKIGVNWSLLTNKEIENQRGRLKNIKFYRPAFKLEEFGLTNISELEEMKKALIYKISNSEDSINHTLHHFEIQYEIDSNLSLLLFKNLLARKEIAINYNRDIVMKNPCSDLFKLEE